VVPLIFVVGAFVVVAVLMLVGMRQRWNDGTRPGWEPDSAPPIEPLPRAYVTLTVVGYLVAIPGLVLAAVFQIPALGIACLVLYAAVWVTRNALIRWRDSLTSVRKVVAIASPLAFVAAIAMMMITSSPWWFLVGGLMYLVPSFHQLHGLERTTPIRITRLKALGLGIWS
jgi:hypothetical protein